MIRDQLEPVLYTAVLVQFLYDIAGKPMSFVRVPTRFSRSSSLNHSYQEVTREIEKVTRQRLAKRHPLAAQLNTCHSSRGQFELSAPSQPTKTIFIGIGFPAVMDVVASHDMFMHIFERIRFFLQRLKHYTWIPLTNSGKIMAQFLSFVLGRENDGEANQSVLSIHYTALSRQPFQNDKILANFWALLGAFEAFEPVAQVGKHRQVSQVSQVPKI
ncbi:hypothetical protein BJV74DRAFT_797635 [Russula compacta]|nr:hypothetical protein BJV74DRAFT_797635 [Russula compacta]